MRAVLMIAYLYPPGAGSSGVLRPLKFSRFLPEHGWTPHVLTARESGYRIKDPTLVAQIPPEAVLHRTLAPNTARHLSVRRKYPAFLAVPDPYVPWLPFGVARGLRVIRRERISALYSTSPPATAHLIAGTLQRLTRVPWVADFRDPWIEDGPRARPHALRHRLESRLERWVVSHASRVAVTTPELGQEIAARHPRETAGKIDLLLNGYDEDDFTGIVAEPGRERFEIVHAGLLNAEFRDPRPVLLAMADLIREGRLGAGRARLTLIGARWARSGAFAESVRQLGLEEAVEAVPFLPHREALTRLSRAAVLLLLQASDDTRSLIPAKAFEYLRLGLPILALTHGGATASLLRDFDGCHVFHPGDDPGIRACLGDLYARWSRGSTLRTPREVSQYGRRRLTAQLAAMLDAVAAGTPVPRREAV